MTRIMLPLVERYGAVAVRGAVSRAQRSLWAPPTPGVRRKRRKEAALRKFQREMARAAAVEAVERATAAAVLRAREEAEAAADKLRRSRQKLQGASERLEQSIAKLLARHRWHLNRTGRWLDLAYMRLRRTPEQVALQARRNARANAGITARLDARLRMLAPILMGLHREGRIVYASYELTQAGVATAGGAGWRVDYVRKAVQQIIERLSSDPAFLTGLDAGTVKEWRELARRA